MRKDANKFRKKWKTRRRKRNLRYYIRNIALLINAVEINNVAIKYKRFTSRDVIFVHKLTFNTVHYNHYCINKVDYNFMRFST